MRTTAISQEEALAKLDRTGCGSTVSFSGIVRPEEGGKAISSLYYEHYPGMAERMIAAILADVLKKFNIRDAVVLHRTGEVPAGDVSVVVAVSSGRRKDGFRACEEIIDRLKKTVPIWKKETGKVTGWQSERVRERKR